MKVSVIITTYARIESLTKALNSLLLQQYQDYEIIIIDQNEKTDEKITNLVNNHREKIKHVKVNFVDGVRGRNEGLRYARGEIAIYCDDDVEAKNNFIENHARNYLDPSIGAVAGRVVTDEDTPVSASQKIGLIRKWDGKVISNFNAETRREVEHAWGCNMSFRRVLLERINGFEESLKGTMSFDDASACFAIRRLGYKIVFDPTAEVKHLFAGSGGCRDMNFAIKMYWYYHNFMFFYLGNMHKIFFPIFFLRQIFGIIRRAIAAKDIKVFIKGAEGLKDGFRDYRKKD